MKLFKRLLAPLSLEEKTLAVLNYARRIAEVNRGEVTLAHVVPTQEYRLLKSVYRPEESGGASGEHAEEVSRARLQEMAQKYLDGVPFKIVVRQGSNAAKAILEIEEEQAPDLVLVAKSQTGDLLARFQGGLIEKLIRSSRAPVWSVSALEELEVQQAVRDVLVPIGFDKPSISVTRSARLFAETQGGRATLLHVILAESSFLRVRREDYGFGPDEPVSLARAQKFARKRLEALAEEHLRGVPYETAVVVGNDVATAVLEEEQVRRPQLVIMAAAPYRGFFHFVLGSDAETVARKAACSVLTIRFE